MKIRTIWLLAALTGLVPAVAGAVDLRAAHPQDPQVVREAAAGEGKLVVDVWTDAGEGSVYHIGDPIQVHFRASRDCYVLVYNLDTEGHFHLLYPYHRTDPHWVSAGREYVLPGAHSSYVMNIEGPPGVEYIQALASLEPFQQLPEWMDPDWAPAEEDLSNPNWRDEGLVVGDPFVGMERINRGILPYDCDEEDCYSAAYTSYYVEHKVNYPRYLCSDCHGPSADVYYDPYAVSCPVFEVRVDYDWRWRRHYPFYGRPYWYYFRRADAPPRFLGLKQRWSSEDGWIHFRDSFGENVLWKKNPGWDPKAGGDPRWLEHRDDGRGGGRGSGGGGGGSGSGGGATFGGGGGGGGGGGHAGAPPPGRQTPGRDFGFRRVRPQPVRVPVQPAPQGPEPLRFWSRSREVAPPSSPRVGIRPQNPSGGQPPVKQSDGGSGGGRDSKQGSSRPEPAREQPRQEPAREQPRHEPAREQPSRDQGQRQEQSRPAQPRPEPSRDRSGK